MQLKSSERRHLFLLSVLTKIIFADFISSSLSRIWASRCLLKLDILQTFIKVVNKNILPLMKIIMTPKNY